MIRRFNRFELKYILPLSVCSRIMKELEHHIPPDSHGGRDGYPVVSLYYDSPQLECFWAKIEGIKFRRKVRLRIYPGADLRQVKTGSIEIKQRINKTVQKRRLELPLEQAKQLCSGALPDTPLDAMDAQVASEIVFLSKALDLQPAAITAYWRRAFEGKEENAGVRVTFDTQVAARIHALEVNEPAVNRLILPADWAIMEVKADDRVPEWATSLLGRHDCQLNRISKYCAGIATLHGLNVLPRVLSAGVTLPADVATEAAANGPGEREGGGEPSAPEAPSSPEIAPPSEILEPPHG